MNVFDCLWMQQLKWWAQTQSNSLDIFERDCLWKETTGNLWTLLEYLKPARGQAQMAGNDSHVSDFCTYYSALPAKKIYFLYRFYTPGIQSRRKGFDSCTFFEKLKMDWEWHDNVGRRSYLYFERNFCIYWTKNKAGYYRHYPTLATAKIIAIRSKFLGHESLLLPLCKNCNLSPKQSPHRLSLCC